jgi:hypothetical protein
MNHQAQKDAARAEALEHYRGNVADPRNGMNQDLHKARDLAAINNEEEFRGKGMTSKPEANSGYKTKIGESC